MPSPLAQRAQPRISVNDLALFMVSSDTARISIVRRSKFPRPPAITRYKDVRPVVCAFLTDSNRRVNALVAASSMFRARADDTTTRPLLRDDAEKSIEVLEALQGMANQLSAYEFRQAPHSQPKLNMHGVEISVRADLFVDGVIRGADHSGASVLRFTQDDADTEAAISKRREMGLYVATLIRRHADENLGLTRPLSNRLCLSIDVQHREAFAAPDAITQRMNNLENACRFISALWDTVEAP